MKRPNITKGKWIACYDVPAALLEGHIVKANNIAKTPIASLWVGGGSHGKPIQKANTKAIAAVPDLLKALETALPSLDDLAAEAAVKAKRNPQSENWRVLAKAYANDAKKVRAALVKAGYTF